EPVPAAPEGPAAAPFTYDFDVDLTAPCEGGGQMQVEATLHVEGDDETEVGMVEYTMTEAPDDCVVTTFNGTEYTLTGGSFTLEIFAESDGQGNATFEGDLEGEVSFQSDDVSGTCPVDVGFELELNTQAQTLAAGASGTVCNRTFSEEFNLSGDVT